MARATQRNQQWVQSHRKLLSDIHRQVRSTVGPPGGEIQRLEASYRKTLSQEYEISTKKDLIEAIVKSQVVLGGDFHADPQSQRTHLRILREIPKEISLTLGMETFDRAHQKWLDLYCAGKISEAQFLKETKWSQRWGFSWSHYQPLMELARENRWKIWAMNQDSKTHSVLARDQFTAQRVSEALKHGAQLVYVIIGDLHLSPSRLPTQVRKTVGIKPTVVHLNSEKLYLDLVAQGRELSAEVVRFKNLDFCIQNSPPWMRWLHYLIHIERWVEDEELHNEHLRQILLFAFRVVTQELGVKLSRPAFEVSTEIEEIKRMGDSAFVTELQRGGFIPGRDCFYIPQLSINRIAGFIGEYLLYARAGSTSRLTLSREDFMARVWMSSWSAFTSRLLNPSRPAEALTDLQIKAKKSERMMDVLKLCLSFKQQELRAISQKSKSLSFPLYRARHRSSYLMASEILGGQIGQRLFWGYRTGLFSRKLIQSWMGTDFARPSFPSSFLEVLSHLSRLGVVTRTKRERL